MRKIHPVTLEVAREVARVIPVIARADSDLARQLRRAVTSVPLNIAEGMYSRGKLRQARYHTALGSSREVLSCLEVAVAMGYVKAAPAELERQLDRVIGTLVKLVPSVTASSMNAFRSKVTLSRGSDAT